LITLVVALVLPVLRIRSLTVVLDAVVFGLGAALACFILTPLELSDPVLVIRVKIGNETRMGGSRDRVSAMMSSTSPTSGFEGLPRSSLK